MEKLQNHGLAIVDSLDNSTRELRFAIEVVEEAALLAALIREDLTEPSLSKRDHSPVTVADLAVQALVAKRLKDAFPEDLLVAEEEAAEVDSDLGVRLLDSALQYLRNGISGVSRNRVLEWISLGESDPRQERFWTLDPIDGTKGFLRGAQYAVALSLLENRQPAIGVLGCPNLRLGDRAGQLVVAFRGGGTWAKPLKKPRFQKLTVSKTGQSDEAQVVRSVEPGHTDAAGIDRFVERIGSKKSPLLMDSQAKYAIVAAGAGDLFLRLVSPTRPGHREKIWDHAAGSLIVEEAGGRVTDLRGAPLDFGNGRLLERNVGVAASNGKLHDIMLQALGTL